MGLSCSRDGGAASGMDRMEISVGSGHLIYQHRDGIISMKFLTITLGQYHFIDPDLCVCLQIWCPPPPPPVLGLTRTGPLPGRWKVATRYEIRPI